MNTCFEQKPTLWYTPTRIRYYSLEIETPDSIYIKTEYKTKEGLETLKDIITNHLKTTKPFKSIITVADTGEIVDQFQRPSPLRDPNG